MSSSFFSRILLPAVAVSGTVFAGLIVLLSSTHLAPFQVDTLPSDAGEGQPVFTRQHGDLTVRYVGLSVIFSTAAGLLTVEMLRKLYAIRTSAQDKAEQLGLDQELLADLVALTAADHANLSAADLTSSEAGSEDISSEDISLFPENFFPPNRLSSPDRALDPSNPYESAPDWQNLAAPADRPPTAPAPLPPGGSVTCLEHPQDYQLGRMPFDPPPPAALAPAASVLVLRWGQLTYRLLRLTPTEAQAYTIATHQADLGDRAVITPYKQRYAVWILAMGPGSS